jgi:hypothetical protein
MSKGTVVILVIISSVLLAVANVAVWAALDVFNPERFGESVAEGLQSSEASIALAGPIVDQLLDESDLPLPVRGVATEAVAWLIQRPLFTPVIKETAAVAFAAMTTSAQDIVGIDLADAATNVGATVTGVISALDPEAGANAQAALEASLAESEESGKLAIYEQGRFPRLRQLANVTPWLALLTGVGAIVLFVVAYMQAWNRHAALRYIGVGIMVAAGLSFLLFAPSVQAVAQNNITNPTMRIVVDQVVSVLIRRFAFQSLLLLFIGLIVLVFNHYRAQQDEPVETSPAI